MMKRLLLSRGLSVERCTVDGKPLQILMLRCVVGRVRLRQWSLFELGETSRDLGEEDPRLRGDVLHH
jgi:hypothetical protein